MWHLRLAALIALGVATRTAHGLPGHVDAPPAVGGPGAPGIVTSPDGRSYAVVATVSREDEPVSSIVTHYTFAVDASGPLVTARGGGHSYTTELIDKFGPGPRPSRWFVAELAAGNVVSLVEAADRAAARKLLPAIAANGLPFASVELASGKHDVVVAARIRERALRGTTTVLTVDPIDGSPAITVSVPDRVRAGSSGLWDAYTWTGDHLVLGLAKGAVVRYLVAHDLPDAKRWEVRLAKHDWPPAWISGGNAGDRAVTRWAASGTVKASASCGPELVFDTYAAAHYVLEPMRVAAPPKVTPGTKMTVVLAPIPKDACGRIARVIRAYVAPTADRTWVIDGKPAPVTPIVE